MQLFFLLFRLSRAPLPHFFPSSSAAACYVELNGAAGGASLSLPRNQHHQHHHHHRRRRRCVPLGRLQNVDGCLVPFHFPQTKYLPKQSIRQPKMSNILGFGRIFCRILLLFTPAENLPCS